MAYGILTVIEQKHHTVNISPSVLNKGGLINPESPLQGETEVVSLGMEQKYTCR